MEQDRSEREEPKRKCKTEIENATGRKRTNEREEDKGMLETGSARDREETRETAFNYPPTYGGEERLVCSGLHHPREPTPGHQPPLFFQRSFHHPLFPRRISRRIFLAPTCKTYFSRSTFRRVSLFFSFLATGKQIHPGEGGESLPAAVLARAAL